MADNDRWRSDQADGRYEDWGGRPDRGRFAERGGGPRGGTENRGGYRGGSSGEDRYDRESRGGYEGGFGGDYYTGFYGADQASRDGSGDRDRAYDRGDDRRGYLDHPRSSEWRNYADPGRGEERGFWDRTMDEVSSWFGGHRGGHEGRGEHRGRGPKGYTRSDERILEDLNDRLTEDPYVDASDIEVGVSNREVTLTGTVDSRGARRRAEDIAESVAGVTHVQNNLRVANRSQGVMTPPKGEAITAMNSSDANRIATETAGWTPTPGTTGSQRR